MSELEALPALNLRQRAWPVKKGIDRPEVVFASREGTMVDDVNLRHVFGRILEKARLRQIRFQDLRHTFSSLLIQQGESLAYVKEQMGHNSIQVTVDVYGHLVPGGNRAAVDRLDDAQPSATPAQPAAVAVGQREPVSRSARIVTQNFASWNQTIAFVRRIDELRRVA